MAPPDWLFRPLSPIASYVAIAVLAVATWGLVIVPLWRFCLLPQNKSLKRRLVGAAIVLAVFALGLWVGWHKDAISARLRRAHKETGHAADDARIKEMVENAIKRGEEWGKQSEQGDVHAQIALAEMYSEGRGVNKDKKKAAELCQKAADQGDPNAQTNLGWMYYEGRGVPQNYRKAAELFQKAADQGYAPGQAYLASRYAEGKGVPKDYQKAIELYHKAVDQEPHPNALNDFAWFLATCPDDSQRNGKLAVTYATKACELTEWKEANFIGTLAAAFAELGDFDAAVRYQKQAMAIAGDYPDKRTMEKALKLYQERKPYRESKSE